VTTPTRIAKGLFDLKSEASRALVAGWAEWTTSKRRSAVRKVLKEQTCPRVERMQIAQIGDAPNRQIGDVDAIMKLGGEIQSPQPSKAVSALCALLAKAADANALVAQLEAATAPPKQKSKKKKTKKKRLLDLDMKKELCGPDGALDLGCSLRKQSDPDDDDDYKTRMTDEL
jgi:hypothetical protein